MTATSNILERLVDLVIESWCVATDEKPVRIEAASKVILTAPGR